MSPEYLLLQRKAIYAIIHDAQYQVLLHVPRRFIADEVLGIIYQGILNCVAAGAPITRETVTDKINAMKLSSAKKSVASVSLVGILSKELPYPSEIQEYLGKAYRQHVAQSLVEKLSDESITDSGRVVAIQEAVTRISEAGEDDAFEAVDVARDIVKRVESGEPTKRAERSIPINHNAALADMFGNIVWPDPYCIAGRAKFRKTGVLMNLMVEFSMSRMPGVLYTFEDDETKATMKYLAARWNGSVAEMDLGRFDPMVLAHVKQNLTTENMPVRIDPRQYRCDEWAMAVRKECMTRETRWIGLDFIQAFSYNRSDEVAELNHITKTIRQLSKEFTIPIIYLCQVNQREEGKGGEVNLHIGNLKGSGSMEEDARCVFLLDGYPHGKTKRWKCVKNNGPLYCGEIDFAEHSGKIVDYRRGVWE